MNDFWKKFFRTFFVVMVVVCVLAWIYLGTSAIDRRYDENVCLHTTDEILIADVGEPAFLSECYANGDFWKLNFGRDIDCSCFYATFEGLGQMDFSVNRGVVNAE